MVRITRWISISTLVAIAPACAAEEPARPTFVAVTFNTGTNPNLPHGDAPDDGYTPAHAMLSDQHYGDGLAWRPVIDATRTWFDTIAPDVVGFQEIFHTAGCVDVPSDARTGFVCEGWLPGDPTVAQRVLGDGYQVACHVGHGDKCVAVKRAFGSIRGCAADLCDEGAFGTGVPDCGRGARVARVVIDLVGGGELVLVNFHGTSGFATADQQCRVAQVDQVFVDLGDGAPAASGAANVIVGDLNTDPGRLVDADASAARWREYAGLRDERSPFRFISDVRDEGPGSYSGLFDIDHVIAHDAGGDCWIAGFTPEHDVVTTAVYFDHAPVVCNVERPAL